MAGYRIVELEKIFCEITRWYRYVIRKWASVLTGILLFPRAFMAREPQIQSFHIYLVSGIVERNSNSTRWRLGLNPFGRRRHRYQGDLSFFP